jgi:hypothetical protein
LDEDCVKTRDLLREIERAAARAGVVCELERHGAAHDPWRVGGTRVVIVRHRETAELTANRVRLALESELGKGWWR